MLLRASDFNYPRSQSFFKQNCEEVAKRDKTLQEPHFLQWCVWWCLSKDCKHSFGSREALVPSPELCLVLGFSLPLQNLTTEGRAAFAVWCQRTPERALQAKPLHFPGSPFIPWFWGFHFILPPHPRSPVWMEDFWLITCHVSIKAVCVCVGGDKDRISDIQSDSFPLEVKMRMV